MATAYAFLRPDGASRFGHVGWGIQLPNGGYFVGSMENPDGWIADLPQWSGFWYHAAADPLLAMRNPSAAGAPPRSPPYVQAKRLDVPRPDPTAAEQQIKSWTTRPYLAVGGNCLNNAYDVLHAFGAPVPDPTPNPALWTPNDWFNNLPGFPLRV